MSSKKKWKPANSNIIDEACQEDGQSGSDPDYFIKRLPSSFPKRKNDVYVNQKSSFVAQLTKCKSLLCSEKEIFIHGLGASVNSAVNLALQLKSFYSEAVTLETTTSTVHLVDEHVPRTADSRSRYRNVIRRNSAIHIKLKQLTT